MNTRLACLGLVLAFGCSDNSASDVLSGSLSVSGTVHDFPSGDEVTGAASVSTTALSPLPTVTVAGASFTIDGIPENSAFQILASVPPRIARRTAR